MPNTYQILSPGADGKYGNGCRFPSGIDYDDANYDDMANFTRGDTMGQAMPKIRGTTIKASTDTADRTDGE